MRAGFSLFLLILTVHSQQSIGSRNTGSAPGIIQTRVPLTVAANGIDGELRIVQDSRLSPSLSKALWGCGEGGVDLEDPKWQFLKKSPLRNAALAMIRSDGTSVETEELDRPLARLGSMRLYSGTGETYLLTVDYSACFGSYSGPAAFLLEVKAGRLKWLEATDGTTGKSERISLADTLKSAWKVVPARSGSGKDILQALCRPSLSSVEPDFKLIYIRYFYDGKQWQKRMRETKGFSEFEDGFPEATLFP